MKRLAVVLITLLIAATSFADTDSTDNWVDSFVVAEGENLLDIKVHGHWLVYHEGRNGKFVYDLAARTPYDKLRQYHRIPYGVNDYFIFDYDPAQDSGWFYRFKAKSRRGFPSRQFGEVQNMWMTNRWMAFTRTWINSQTRERGQALVYTALGGRWDMNTIVQQFDPDSIAVGGDYLIWYGTTIDAEGIYACDVTAKKPQGKRVIEVEGQMRPDTDGKHIVWFTQDSAYLYDLQTGETRDLLEDRLNRSCTAIRIAGDWVVWTDDDWNLLARHLPTDRVVTVASPEDTGAIELVDIDADHVIWKTGQTLHAAKLTAKQQ